MKDLTIKTNYHWHNFLYGYELTDEQKSEFDWLDDIDSESFMKYKGNIYHLDEFMPSDFSENWDGYAADSYFSGVLVRVSDDAEQYQIATYYI